MSQEYHYAPLETLSTIRVIKIQEEKVNNQVACVIRHIERNDLEQTGLEYEALSYVWGIPDATRHVYLGNEADQKCLFPLHENLWRFLNWAWGRQIFDRWIWTDRMSLNQDDDSEIAQQIPRMGEIFSNAKQVMAWLGMPEQDGEDVAYMRDCKEELSTSTVSRYLHHKKRLGAADRVRENQYWGRVWIVQEIGRAKRVSLIIGNVEVDLKYFMKRHHDLRLAEKLRVESPIDNLSNLHNLDGKSELWEILEWITTSGFKCKRPQDRVYGILGLVKPHDDGTSPTDHIRVDYERSASEVMLDAVLESHSPWKFVQIMSEILVGKRGLEMEPTFDLFEKYLGSDRTSERHKRLALYSFQACDALVRFFDLCGRFPERTKFGTFEQLIFRISYDTTMEESAVLIGIGIVLGGLTDDVGKVRNERDLATVFENWRKSRQKRSLPRRVMWRCAKHMRRREHVFRRGQDYVGGLLHSYHRRSFGSWSLYYGSSNKEGSFDPGRAVRACCEYKNYWNSCDGSTMMFEIPEVGFRLIMQPDWENKRDCMFLYFQIPRRDEEKEEKEERERKRREEHEKARQRLIRKGGGGLVAGMKRGLEDLREKYAERVMEVGRHVKRDRPLSGCVSSDEWHGSSVSTGRPTTQPVAQVAQSSCSTQRNPIN